MDFHTENTKSNITNQSNIITSYILLLRKVTRYNTYSYFESNNIM